MKTVWGFDAELERLHKEFKLGDYRACAEAFAICLWNKLPVPEWVGEQVFDALAHTLEHQPTGRGRKSNRAAQSDAKQIEDRRADMAERHLKARWKEKGRYLSMLGAMHGYGKPHPTQPHVHIVTSQDIFSHVEKELRGTFAQGSARMIGQAHRKARKNRRYGPP